MHAVIRLEVAESVVRTVSVEKVLSGSANVPFYNKAAWRSVQQGCTALTKTNTYPDEWDTPL